tara:strand:- start:1728 stop:2144 length:417 start_codon:yes stop_codon:yes gene_type:complete
MPAQFITQLAGNPFLKFFDFGIDKFNHRPRIEVYQVIVMIPLCILVARAPVAKLQLVEDTCLLKKLDRAIHGRNGNPMVKPGGAGEQFLDVRVIVTVLYYLGYDPALAGHPKPLVFTTFQDGFGHRAPWSTFASFSDN